MYVACFKSLDHTHVISYCEITCETSIPETTSTEGSLTMTEQETSFRPLVITVWIFVVPTKLTEGMNC